MDTSLSLAERQERARRVFGSADLGDVRRTRRLVTLAAQMAGNTSGSIPQQTLARADMKAAYRLFDAPEVTHAAITAPHTRQTRQRASEYPVVFLLQDTTVLNFTSHRACSGLGPIGPGGSLKGLYQHNVLAADPVTRRPLGLMYQKHHRRQERRRNREAKRQARPDLRESYWWIRAIKTLGSPPPQVRWVHVGDRGEDLFGVYAAARQQGTDWLIRVAQDRRILTSRGQAGYLMHYARSLPERRRESLWLRRKPGAGPEPVTLSLAGQEVQLLPASHERWHQQCPPVSCWVIRVWEPGNPDLEWILCTSLSCQSDEELAFAARGYSLRWLIEEYHKCLKTGCNVESRRLESAARLEALIGLLSIIAIWLLELKFVARDEPQRPAREIFDITMVQIMARFLNRPANTLSISEFWEGIGRLGGHPGRKGDGPIGWLRAWRGWQSFELMMLGATLASG